MKLDNIYEDLIFRWKNGRAYHLNINETDVSSYIITSGSSSRIKTLADYLEDPVVREVDRGFTVVKGFYKDIQIFGFSSGIGPSSIAITLSEVLYYVSRSVGLAYIIRVGTAGPLQEYITRYSIVIADSVVRDESTSSRIIYPEYPAKMDPIIYLSLLESAYRHGYMLDKNLFLGVVHSKDDLYYYEGFQNSPIKDYNKERFKALKMMGVLATEMESSILPILRDYFKSRLRRENRNIGIYVGSILLILKDEFDKEIIKENEYKLLKISIDSMKIIDDFIKGKESLENILRWVSTGY